MVTEEKVQKLQTEMEREKGIRQLYEQMQDWPLNKIGLNASDRLRDILDADHVVVALLNPEGAELSGQIRTGGEVKNLSALVEEPLALCYSLRECESLLFRSPEEVEESNISPEEFTLEHPTYETLNLRPGSVISVPLTVDSQKFGSIEVRRNPERRPFDGKDLSIIEDIARNLAFEIRERRRIKGQKTRWDLLIREGIINDEHILQARKISRQEDVSEGHVLINDFAVPADNVRKSLSDYYNLPHCRFSEETTIPADVIENLDPEFMRLHRWVPVESNDEGIEILMEDPHDVQTRDYVERGFDRPVTFCVGLREDVLKFIDYYFTETPEMEVEMDKVEIQDLISKLGKRSVNSTRGADWDLSDESFEENDMLETQSGIIRLVNRILFTAYRKGVSDVHFEADKGKDMLVRFRRDGVCSDYTTIPSSWARAVISRIKIMSSLDISERRRPQDGKIKISLPGQEQIEIRVAIIPTFGNMEDAVLRILPGSQVFGIDQTGMRPEVLEAFKKIIRNPYGIVLTVGPTGSGKTTTLHGALKHIKSPETKICTAEDPVEITQDRIRQLQVNKRIGLTFDTALRAFLRSDPDVIMIGEIRDPETADMAIQASLTGHLVFSTLHTDNAPDTIPRLMNLGVDEYSFADALRGILAQRLVRTFCEHCKEHVELTDERWDQLRREFNSQELFEQYAPQREDVELYEANGCDECNQTGYHGRTGIFELIPRSEGLRDLIYERATAGEIRDFARDNGVLSMKQDGVLKVMQGTTDLPEVNRVCIE